MKLVKATDPYDWAAILRLIQTAFAGMEGRIDPPSSMHRLTPEAIATQALTGEVWVIEDPAPIACVFLTPKPDCLYLGKLAVFPARQSEGIGRHLVSNAIDRCRALGFDRLELETRIELIENHRAFAKMGFKEVARTAHPGYDRPTSLTMQQKVTPNEPTPEIRGPA